MTSTENPALAILYPPTMTYDPPIDDPESYDPDQFADYEPCKLPEEDAIDYEEFHREHELLMDDLASDSDDFSRSEDEGWYYSDDE